MAELVVMTTERIEKVVAEEKEEKLDCERADVILAGADEQAIAWVNGKHRAPRGGPIAHHRGIHRWTS